MAEIRNVRCQLITPDREVLDAEATAVVLPAHDGELGVLKNRAPLLCKLGIGTCRIALAERTRHYYVDGGFARVLDNRVTILTQDARTAEEVDVEAAERLLAEARGRSARDPAAQERRRLDIARASAQIRLARR